MISFPAFKKQQNLIMDFKSYNIIYVYHNFVCHHMIYYKLHIDVEQHLLTIFVV